MGCALTVSLYLPHIGMMTNCTSEKSDSIRPVYHPHLLLGMPVSWTNSLTYLRPHERHTSSASWLMRRHVDFWVHSSRKDGEERDGFRQACKAQEEELQFRKRSICRVDRSSAAGACQKRRSFGACLSSTGNMSSVRSFGGTVSFGGALAGRRA